MAQDRRKVVVVTGASAGVGRAGRRRPRAQGHFDAKVRTRSPLLSASRHRRWLTAASGAAAAALTFQLRRRARHVPSPS